MVAQPIPVCRPITGAPLVVSRVMVAGDVAVPVVDTGLAPKMSGELVTVMACPRYGELSSRRTLPAESTAVMGADASWPLIAESRPARFVTLVVRLMIQLPDEVAIVKVSGVVLKL
ncbi:hypothetical protein FQZ97_826550 [compost metagenome]